MVDALRVGLELPPPVGRLETAGTCAFAERRDWETSWTSGYRPTYQCVDGGCVRRGSWSGVAGLRPWTESGGEPFGLYPSCSACAAHCPATAEGHRAGWWR